MKVMDQIIFLDLSHSRLFSSFTQIERVSRLHLYLVASSSLLELLKTLHISSMHQLLLLFFTLFFYPLQLPFIYIIAIF